jgi:hypothetical protein
MGNRCFWLVALLVGAGIAPLSAQGAASDSLLPGHTVDVSAGEYAFRAPDTIPAGLTTFRLRQEGRVKDGMRLSPAGRDSLVTHAGDATGGFHMLWVVRLDSGSTAADLFRAERDRAPMPGRILGGPGFAYPPGTTNATMMLEPGNYVLACFVGSAREDRNRYHLLKGMFRPLTVLPANGAPAPLPAPDVVLTIDSADQVTFSTPITRAGPWRVLVRNNSAKRLELAIVRVLPGHTAEEARGWRRREGKPPVSEPWGGLAGVSKGDSMLTTINFIPGTYITHGTTIQIQD